MKSIKNILVLLLISVISYNTFAQDKESIIKAMKDEINRSLKDLNLKDLKKPYYIEYKLTVREVYSIKSIYGSLVENDHNKNTQLSVGIRVGNYKFDNTNYFDFGLSFFGSGDEEERFKSRSIQNEIDYASLRRELWLATDAAYKQVAETYTKKETTLKNRIINDTTWDFLPVKPEKYSLVKPIPDFNVENFKSLTKDLSGIFNKYPEINTSSVGVEYIPETIYYLNSEGIEYVKTVYYAGLEAVAATQTKDGMPLADYYTVFTINPADMPGSDSLTNGITKIAENLKKLTQAKTLDESYSGPILFTEQASAQLFAQQFAPNLTTQREPLTEQGKQDNDRFTAFQNKIGGRVMPEFLSVIADPFLTKFSNTNLIGKFTLDDEGIVPEKVNLVTNGYLKNLLSTRVPTKRVRKSNGHQRGGAAMYGILELNTDNDHSKSFNELKEKIIKLCKDRELPFGIIVNKLIDQNILFTTLFKLTAGTYPVGQIQSNIPAIEAYKIYQDGKTELIRGCEIRGINAQTFKDIILTGNDKYALNFLASPVVSPFISGGSSYLTSSVITPALLFEDGEVKPIENDFPKPPIISSPF